MLVVTACPGWLVGAPNGGEHWCRERSGPSPRCTYDLSRLCIKVQHPWSARS